MADNTPSPEGTTPPPQDKLTSSGRVTVSLSSVAKNAPQQATNPGAIVAPPRQVPATGRTGILPAKETVAASQARLTTAAPPGRPQLNRTMEVKLPPKTGVLPKLTSLASMPLSPAEKKIPAPAVISPQPPLPRNVIPPPLPTTPPETAKIPEPAPAPIVKEAPRRLPPFRLKAVPLSNVTPGESIFPDAKPAAAKPPAQTPPGWKHLEPGELTVPADVLKNPAITKFPPVPAKQETMHAPPTRGEAPVFRPPPVEPAKTETPSLHMAPPLAGAPATPHTEKLRLPPAVHHAPKTDFPKLETPKLEPPKPAAKAPPMSEGKGSTVPPRISVSPPVARVAIKTGALPPPLPPPPVKSVIPPVAAAAAGAAVIEPTLFKMPEKKSADTPPTTGPRILSTITRGAPFPTRKNNETSFLLPAAPAKPPEPTVVEPPKEFPPIKASTDPIPAPSALSPPITDAPPPKQSFLKKTKTTGKLPKVAPFAVAGAVGAAAAAGAAVSKTAEPVATLPPTRAERAKKRRLVGTIIFYILFLGVVCPLLFLLTVHFSSETRVEGQVIPPHGTILGNEVWIVTDFRELATGVADDLAAERAPKLQEIQEKQDHVQRAQADIAAREERIRLLNEQMQGAKDEIASTIKQAHDAAQQVWDGPGASLDNDYKSRLDSLQQAIAARAKSLNLNYQPDNTYQSPEVWANAYRLALYQTPAGVDGVKEHQWIEDQLKSWRDYTKNYDAQKDKLRLQAAQIQSSPTPQITDLNSKIEDLQHRVDSTQAEEDPLKTELQQAQTDLVQAQTTEAGLDAKYYTQLYALPESSITKRLPLRENGRFSWQHLEKDSSFAEGEKSHNFWIFSRAIRPDGRQFWAISRFTIGENSILPILIEPESFVSTKAILRPDLSTDEQAQ